MWKELRGAGLKVEIDISLKTFRIIGKNAPGKELLYQQGNINTYNNKMAESYISIRPQDNNQPI